MKIEISTGLKDFISPSWQKILADQISSSYFKTLENFIAKEKEEGIIYPSDTDIFNAFNQTAFNSIKVVLIGQDPYHGDGQAHGLSFSVKKGIKIPPSLKNIYKELSSDIDDFIIPEHGNLTKWAQQGILLLNAILTVRAHEAASHHKQGWETFTDAIIEKISSDRTGIVFLLWGKYAEQKEKLINPEKHLILKAAHPSPFSAHNGFFGCHHFSQVNNYLIENGETPIDGKLNEELRLF